jgi:hypothetical protein
VVQRRRRTVFPFSIDPAGLLTAIIVLAWMGSYAYQFISPTWVAPTSLDPLMLLVASAYIGKNTIQQRSDRRRDDEDEVAE